MMKITKEQQEAIEEAQEKHLDEDINYSAHLIGKVDIEDLQQFASDSFWHGAMEVLNFPEKYGLVNWQSGGNTVVSTPEYNKIKESLMDKQATINEHNELLGTLLAEIWGGTSTETVNDIIQDFIRLKNKF